MHIMGIDREATLYDEQGDGSKGGRDLDSPGYPELGKVLCGSEDHAGETEPGGPETGLSGGVGEDEDGDEGAEEEVDEIGDGDGDGGAVCWRCVF